METSEARLTTALTRLQMRWGTAAVRLGNGDPSRASDQDAAAGGHASPSTHGALALAAAPLGVPGGKPVARDSDVVPTGFAALDAILGTGGLPREASATIRGDASSGKTTIALRCIAEAQMRGAIVAYLDLASAFDPLEAVSRGVDLRWLVVLRPLDPSEGFALAGALLAGRAVDLLVIDLPARLAARQEGVMRRLMAHVRRVGARLIVLEPSTLTGPVHGALAEVSSVRLELQRWAWIRRGRDVVGQQTAVTVAKNRFGPPGRHARLEIHYAEPPIA